MGIEDFRGTMPEFRSEEFLVGKLKSWAYWKVSLGACRSALQSHRQAMETSRPKQLPSLKLTRLTMVTQTPCIG